MNGSHPHHSAESHAWIELARTGLPKRPASERVADFLEIYGLYDEVVARDQASRCVQCPDPLCVAGCPVHAHIPEWLALTAAGQIHEAASLVQSTNTLAEVCAKVCPADHLCESTCIITGRAAPVSIWAVEQFLNDYALAHGLVPEANAPANGWRVAVLGAGPGGLACADELAQRGYAVTVFDSRPVAGGLLVYGTPAFRLERSIVERRVEVLKKRGVVFRLGANIGRDPSREELQSRFDCVYLGLGARRARPLDLPGARLQGVSQAVPFIAQAHVDLPREAPPVDVTGRRIVVLGGGDTAIDCLRTAIRCGAREVTGIYRRDAANMPCSHREYENALEEGVRFVFQSAPVAILDNDHGAVSGLRLVRTAPGALAADGRRTFAAQPGTEYEREADHVFLALGFDPDTHPASNPFADLRVNQAGLLEVDARQMTSTPGVFAGGDLVRGPSHALDAVRDARKAAAGIAAFLTENTVRQSEPAAVATGSKA
jgi:glutamate synthase (NADPH/NADH) small chain